MNPTLLSPRLEMYNVLLMTSTITAVVPSFHEGFLHNKCILSHRTFQNYHERTIKQQISTCTAINTFPYFDCF
jgi:hypothetical protein